jgi:2-polyprenyl-3-methyl-5-hydroxy-6-metoxy-1,4-benzoquinol methylase
VSQLFDQVAYKFALDTDSAISKGTYLRGELFVDLAQKMIPSNSRILDYGCGPGRLSCLLARCGFQVRGVDTSVGMIELARSLDLRGLDIEFQTISRPDEALPPSAYDAIVCSSVIEYVADVDELLRGFHGALGPQGHLLISYANASSYWRKRWTREAAPNPMGPSQHHVWDWMGFRKLLEKNGFQTTARPKFFESPWDNRPWGKWFRRSSLVGSLGVVVARSAPLSVC